MPPLNLYNMSIFKTISKIASKAVSDLNPISSLIGTAGTIASGVNALGKMTGLSKSSQQQSFEEQKRLMDLQYQYQTKLNEQQQVFARENALTDYTRTRELAYDKYTIDKLGKQAAGHSTSLADGSNVGSITNTTPVASPSAGSISMPPSSTELQYQSMQTSLGVAQLFKTMAEARKLGADTRSIESKTDKEVVNLDLLNESQKLQNEYQSLINTITSSTVKERIEQIKTELSNSMKLGNLTDTQISELRKRIAKITSETNLTDEQTRQLKEINEKYLDMLQESIIKMNTATAEYQHEQAQDNRATRSSRIQQLKSSTRLNNANAETLELQFEAVKTEAEARKVMADITIATKDLRSQFENTKLDHDNKVLLASIDSEIKKLESEADIAQQEADFYKFNKITENISTLINSATSLTVGLKNASELRKSHTSSTTTTIKYDKNGRKTGSSTVTTNR